jgi:hypothetical protein
VPFLERIGSKKSFLPRAALIGLCGMDCGIGEIGSLALSVIASKKKNIEANDIIKCVTHPANLITKNYSINFLRD